MRASVHLAGALLLALLVRFPFWVEALKTPLDGDTAIIGLMARQPFESWTMWGQPYGSPLDAWLAAPFVAALGMKAASIRLVYFLLGLALVPLAYFLGRALHPAAALPAAVLLACPPPYLLLLATLPPPLYSAALILGGLLLLLTQGVERRLAVGGRPVVWVLLLGALAGLALWTHLMLASLILVCAAYLAVRQPRQPLLLLAPLPALVVGAPGWWRPFGESHAAGVVALSGRSSGFLEHLGELLPQLHRPIGGLLGSHVPLVADDIEHVVFVPALLAALLALTYGGALILAVRSARRQPAAWLLLAGLALVLLVFPLPQRSGPGTIRFLSPAYLPLAVLVAWSPIASSARGRGSRRAFILVLFLACLHLLGGMRLLEAWRSTDRALPPFLLPDLQPVQQALEQRGIRHAYASYGPAYRLTFESGGRIVASQPWNERFRHYPLPLLDEVRFARSVAWVLTPAIPTDLPGPHVFEPALAAIGGRYERIEVGEAAIFHGFVPPFDPEVHGPAGAGVLADGDLASALEPLPAEPLRLDLDPPEALDGLALVAPSRGPRLPRSLDVEVLYTEADSFLTVVRRRRRQERHDLRWLNGHPQYVLDHDLIAVRLEGVVRSVRVVPVASDEPWGLAELLLHPAQAPSARRPWDEWLNPFLSWPERRQALAAKPLPREDWYYRTLLAERRAGN